MLADRVARLMLFATMRDPAKWRAAALELVPGLSAVVGGATRATVIPHEVLWRVPFEALPADSGYLADSTSFVYAPSVTALVRAPGRPTAAAAPGVLLAVAAAPIEAPRDPVWRRWRQNGCFVRLSRRRVKSMQSPERTGIHSEYRWSTAPWQPRPPSASVWPLRA